MTQINIDNVDPKLKKDFKRWCLENDTTMSAEFIKLMEERTRKKNKKEAEKK